MACNQSRTTIVVHTRMAGELRGKVVLCNSPMVTVRLNPARPLNFEYELRLGRKNGSAESELDNTSSTLDWTEPDNSAHSLGASMR